jgi:hypothetical protein
MICNIPINARCSDNMTPGRETFPGPAAIVLIALGHSIDQYHALTTAPIMRWYPTAHPKSVHYAVDAAGNVYQYVEDQNTAWGIDALHNPTWPGIQAATDPASQFLFVGIEGQGILSNAGQTALARLLCCLTTEHNLVLDELTVIVARDLDDTLDTIWSVPVGLIALAQSECWGGMSTSDLVQCCSDNTAAIEALEDRVDALEIQVCAITDENGPIVALQEAVASLQAGLTELQLRVLALESTAGASAQQYALLAQAIALHQVCIDVMCPPATALPNIEYYGEQLPFTALTPNWLNPTIKVSDTVPPSVMTGPMWAATLATPATYLVEARVRFAIGDWCTGKQAWLDLVVNSGAVRLSTVTVAAGGIQSIELVGSTTLTVPPTSVVHLSVQSNDSTALARVIDLAWIKITRI